MTINWVVHKKPLIINLINISVSMGHTVVSISCATIPPKQMLIFCTKFCIDFTSVNEMYFMQRASNRLPYRAHIEYFVRKIIIALYINPRAKVPLMEHRYRDFACPVYAYDSRMQTFPVSRFGSVDFVGERVS